MLDPSIWLNLLVAYLFALVQWLAELERLSSESQLGVLDQFR